MPIAALLALPLVPRIVAASDIDTEALCAFGAGRFGDAAALLEQSSRKPQRGEGDGRAYFLARSLRELGLRGLAIRSLARAAVGDPAWRRLARQELVRLEFERGADEAVWDLLEHSREPTEPAVFYFAGLTAARQRQWPRAVELLGALPSGEPLYPYARYARAQAESAAGDLGAALEDLAEAIRYAPQPAAKSNGRQLESGELPQSADSAWLRVVFVSPSSGVSLADRAALLRGKILYLEGRMSEARTAFAAVRADGPMALESARGLVLTGDVDSASGRIEHARPTASAALLLAEALAAGRTGKTASAQRVRTTLRTLARERLATLERIPSDPSVKARMTADLVTFAAKMAQARAPQPRWPEEAAAAGVSCSFGPLEPASRIAFRPSEDLFYDLWEQVRGDPRLADLLDAGATGARLAVDLRTPVARRPFWALWRDDDDLRRGTLLVLRLAGLELRLVDALRVDDRNVDLASAERRRAALRRAIAALDRLYPGSGHAEAALTEQRERVLETALRVDNRATDDGISTLGNYVDLLAGTRPRQSTPSVLPSEVLNEIRRRNRELVTEIETELERAVDGSLHAQAAFYVRLEADNESSLSRLYARSGGEPH